MKTKTRNNVTMTAYFFVLAAVITLQDVFTNYNLRIVLSLALAIVFAYIISRSTIQEPSSYRAITRLLIAFFVFTCVYHILLSVALGQSIFANYYWGFLCVIYLLIWLRVRYGPQK
jgi:hypothetical protein